MYKLSLALVVAAMAVAGCTTTEDEMASVETPPPSVGAGSPIQGAVVGAPAGGLPGAVWADRDADEIADGYYYGGRYYPGVPPSQPAYQQQASRTGERG